jgi:hypothetical protein
LCLERNRELRITRVDRALCILPRHSPLSVYSNTKGPIISKRFCFKFFQIVLFAYPWLAAGTSSFSAGREKPNFNYLNPAAAHGSRYALQKSGGEKSVGANELRATFIKRQLEWALSKFDALRAKRLAPEFRKYLQWWGNSLPEQDRRDITERVSRLEAMAKKSRQR